MCSDLQWGDRHCALLLLKAGSHTDAHVCGQLQTWAQLMEDALAALEIWKALFSSTCPRKLVKMTRPSMAQSKCPGSTALSG